MLSAARLEALRLSQGLDARAANIDRVARAAGAEEARWAFTQWSLRARARAKFSRADEMLFDRDGLEMATPEDLAAELHAAVFPEGAQVVDVTAGIGGDLIALARHCAVRGIEIDAERAGLDMHNAEVYGRTVAVECADCLDSDWPEEFVYADPARRSGGQRTIDPSRFLPRIDHLVDLCRNRSLCALKLSPLLSDEFLESLSPDRWFVSHSGECKMVLAFVGTEVANCVKLQGVWARTEPGGVFWEGGRPVVATLDEPLAYVVEADPAVIRAHALGGHGLPSLGSSNGYLTSAERPVAGFEVLWSGSFSTGNVKSNAKRLGVRIEAVKVRGVPLDVQAVLRELAKQGDEPGVLIVYPVGRKARAILCRRL